MKIPLLLLSIATDLVAYELRADKTACTIACCVALGLLVAGVETPSSARR